MKLQISGSRLSAYREIRWTVGIRYQEHQRSSGWLQCLIRWLKIERETYRDLRRLFPPSVL